MNIKEANRVIANIYKNNKHSNIYWRFKPSYSGGIYLNLEANTYRSSTIGDSSDKIHFDGIKTVGEVASFLMTDARKEGGRFSIRKNGIKLYRDIWKRNVLKLIVDHNVSIVYFKDFIEC